MNMKRTTLFVLPVALLLPLTAMAGSDNSDTDALKIDTPTAQPGGKLLVSGQCNGAGETVKFRFTQNGKTRSFPTQAKTRKKRFKTTLDLAQVHAQKKGIATLHATCSGGKKLMTDFQMGARPATLSTQIMGADKPGDASSGPKRNSGQGHGSGKLRIDSKNSTKMGGKFTVTGKCPGDEGPVKFSIVQKGKTHKLDRLVNSTQSGFHTQLKLDPGTVHAGKAKLVASCPAGKLLTNDIEIAK